MLKRQQTPNPNALKYVLDKKEFERPLNFSSEDAASDHPLARQLFGLGSIYNVFMAQDFVTINKLPDAAWEPLATEAEQLIANYFDS